MALRWRRYGVATLNAITFENRTHRFQHSLLLLDLEQTQGMIRTQEKTTTATKNTVGEMTPEIATIRNVIGETTSIAKNAVGETTHTKNATVVVAAAMISLTLSMTMEKMKSV